MNTKRDWTQVAVVVVLALASLSSMAVSAPHRDRLNILADVCGEIYVSEWDQYAAAIEWAEQGGTEVPLALSVVCTENSPNFDLSLAEMGIDSGERWEQYMAAIEGRELELDAAPVHTVAGGASAFDQYTAAIEWAERGGQVPQALTVSGGENNVDLIASPVDNGGDSWARFEQYMSAIEGTVGVVNAASARTVTLSPTPFDQYMAAIRWAEQGGPVPEALLVGGGVEGLNANTSFADHGGDSWVRFEQYMAAIEGSEVRGVDLERRKDTEEYLAELALLEPEDPFAHLAPTG